MEKVSKHRCALPRAERGWFSFSEKCRNEDLPFLQVLNRTFTEKTVIVLREIVFALHVVPVLTANRL